MSRQTLETETSLSERVITYLEHDFATQTHALGGYGTPWHLARLFQTNEATMNRTLQDLVSRGDLVIRACHTFNVDLPTTKKETILRSGKADKAWGRPTDGGLTSHIRQGIYLDAEIARSSDASVGPWRMLPNRQWTQSSATVALDLAAAGLGQGLREAGQLSPDSWAHAAKIAFNEAFAASNMPTRRDIDRILRQHGMESFRAGRISDNADKLSANARALMKELTQV